MLATGVEPGFAHVRKKRAQTTILQIQTAFFSPLFFDFPFLMHYHDAVDPNETFWIYFFEKSCREFI